MLLVGVNDSRLQRQMSKVSYVNLVGVSSLQSKMTSNTVSAATCLETEVDVGGGAVERQHQARVVAGLHQQLGAVAGQVDSRAQRQP